MSTMSPSSDVSKPMLLSFTCELTCVLLASNYSCVSTLLLRPFLYESCILLKRVVLLVSNNFRRSRFLSVLCGVPSRPWLMMRGVWQVDVLFMPGVPLFYSRNVKSFGPKFMRTLVLVGRQSLSSSSIPMSFRFGLVFCSSRSFSFYWRCQSLRPLRTDSAQGRRLSLNYLPLVADF